MKTRNLVAALFAAVSLAFAPVDGAQAAVSCTDGYLLCLNEAQDSSRFWRTVREFECGVGFYGCMARKAAGG
ncbi:MAG TPA: hypothetical protein VMN78_05595 [Longimicrobiales bacterium]|nr:hypothetical protein [Longimicrobiales bacterium]